jgi:hypothetical protein
VGKAPYHTSNLSLCSLFGPVGSSEKWSGFGTGGGGGSSVVESNLGDVGTDPKVAIRSLSDGSRSRSCASFDDRIGDEAACLPGFKGGGGEDESK